MSAETRKFLKVAEGRTVRREADGQPWDAAGEFAEDSRFIRRRLADGDLVEAEPPAELEASADAGEPETPDAPQTPAKPDKPPRGEKPPKSASADDEMK